MYELIQVTDNTYYIDCPAKIGIVKIGEGEVVLIDSGNNKDTGKRIKKILDAQGWALKAIYNTHSHADHIGGNNYLQTQTGCKIYAYGIERDFAERTILEPSYLYGASPPKALRHKFLLADESDVLPLFEDSLPEGWEMLEFPGHSFDMVGFKTPDDVVFVADCFSSKQTLEKYQIGFLYDVATYLETLESLKNMRAKMFIPSHADCTDNITELVQFNIDKVNEIADKILRICETPICFEDLLKKLFDQYSLALTIEQYVLVGSSVKAYLTYLLELEKIENIIQDNKLLWQTKKL